MNKEVGLDVLRRAGVASHAHPSGTIELSKDCLLAVLNYTDEVIGQATAISPGESFPLKILGYPASVTPEADIVRFRADER